MNALRMKICFGCKFVIDEKRHLVLVGRHGMLPFAGLRAPARYAKLVLCVRIKSSAGNNSRTHGKSTRDATVTGVPQVACGSEQSPNRASELLKPRGFESGYNVLDISVG